MNDDGRMPTQRFEQNLDKSPNIEQDKTKTCIRNEGGMPPVTGGSILLFIVALVLGGRLRRSQCISRPSSLTLILEAYGSGGRGVEVLRKHSTTATGKRR